MPQCPAPKRYDKDVKANSYLDADRRSWAPCLLSGQEPAGCKVDRGAKCSYLDARFNSSSNEGAPCAPRLKVLNSSKILKPFNIHDCHTCAWAQLGVVSDCSHQGILAAHSERGSQGMFVLRCKLALRNYTLFKSILVSKTMHAKCLLHDRCEWHHFNPPFH